MDEAVERTLSALEQSCEATGGTLVDVHAAVAGTLAVEENYWLARSLHRHACDQFTYQECVSFVEGVLVSDDSAFETALQSSLRYVRETVFDVYRRMVMYRVLFCVFVCNQVSLSWLCMNSAIDSWWRLIKIAAVLLRS